MDKPGDGQAEEGHEMTMTTYIDNLAFWPEGRMYIFPWIGTTMIIGTMSKVNGRTFWIDVTAFTTTMDD